MIRTNHNRNLKHLSGRPRETIRILSTKHSDNATIRQCIGETDGAFAVAIEGRNGVLHALSIQNDLSRPPGQFALHCASIQRLQQYGPCARDDCRVSLADPLPIIPVSCFDHAFGHDQFKMIRVAAEGEGGPHGRH